MTDANQLFTQKLLDLEQQLSFELNAFSDNVNALTEAPTQTQYDRYCGHLNYIQELISDADRLTRSLTLDRNDPAFFSLLKAKDQIREHGITYARLRGSFYQKYKPEESRDQDLERVLAPEEVHPEIEDVILPEEDAELTDEELLQLEQEAWNEENALAAAEKDAALAGKKKKRLQAQRRQEEVRRRQYLAEQAQAEEALRKQNQAAYQQQIELSEAERLAQQAYLRQDTDTASRIRSDLEPQPEIQMPPSPQAPVSDLSDRQQEAEIQHARWEEANRLGIHQDPQKAISEAQLAEERARQQEAEHLSEQAAYERQVRHQATQERFRQRQEQAEQHVRLEKGHVDFSHDLYETKQDEQSSLNTEQPEDPALSKQDTSPHFTQERRESPLSPERDAAYPDTVYPGQRPENGQNAYSQPEQGRHSAVQQEPDTPPSREVPLSPAGEPLQQEPVSFDRPSDHPASENHADFYDAHKREEPLHTTEDRPSFAQDPIRDDADYHRDEPMQERWRQPRDPEVPAQEHHAYVPPLSPESAQKDPETSDTQDTDRREHRTVAPNDRPSHRDHDTAFDRPAEPRPQHMPEPPNQTHHTFVPPLSPAGEQTGAAARVTQDTDRQEHDTIAPDERPSYRDRDTHSDEPAAPRPHHMPEMPRETQQTVVPPLSPAGEQTGAASRVTRDTDRREHGTVVPDERPSYRDRDTHSEGPASPRPHHMPEMPREAQQTVVPPLSPHREQAETDSPVTHVSDRTDQKTHSTPQNDRSGAFKQESSVQDDPQAPDWYRHRQERQWESAAQAAKAKSNAAMPRPQTQQAHVQDTTVHSANEKASGRAESTVHKQDAPTSAYRYTPFGVREEPRAEYAKSHPSRSNAQIYEKIKSGMTKAGTDEPITISSAYVSSMAWNVHMARIDYQGKKDTPDGIAAVHHYQRQRQALENLKADVRAGRVIIEQPKVPEGKAIPPDKQAKKEGTPYTTQYNFTPYGVTGSNLDENGRVTGSFRINTKAVRENFRYNAEQPLKVSPKYEKAFQDRLDKATTALDTALQLQTKLPPKISTELHDELRLAQDAYAAFRQAKQKGAVVVTGDSDKERPNFVNWQLRKQANIFGSTVSPKAINLNQVRSEEVEDVSPSVLRKKSKLRHEYLYNRYLRSLGQKTMHYSYAASSIFSRNLYLLTQMGDDNALRTFENGRYYTVTAAKLTYAVTHMHVVAPGKRTRQTSKIERHRFAKYMDKDRKTLGSEISDKKRLGRESKKVLKNLKAEKTQLNEKVESLVRRGAGLTKEEQLLLKQLGARQRKVHAQLETAQRSHNALNRDLRKEVAYLKFRKDRDEELRVLNELREKHGQFVTRGKLRRDMEETQAAARRKLNKKYGKLAGYSEKSVKAEIKNLTKQAKALKGQIKVMQAKGSALSQAQRLALKHMMDEHKEISKKLRLFIGLDKDRALLNAELQLKSGLLNRMYKNANAVSNAMFAMQRFILRPLREGAEYGVQGFGAGMGVLTNRRVHLIMKKVFKVAIRYGPTAVLTLVTGDIHTANAVVTSVNRAAKAAVTSAKYTAKRAVTNTGKLVAQGSKKAVSAITPQPVKDGAHYAAKSVKKSFKTVTAFKQKVSRKFWSSRVGQSISSVNNFMRNTSAMVSKALSLAKSVMVKFVAGFVLLFLLCGIIASLAGAPAGGAVSSIIMTPYESGDGNLDLSPYQDVLNKEWLSYEGAIEALKTEYAGNYDRVTVNMPFPDDNSREILSMMAVRMFQDLDMSENPQVKQYLQSIFADSHYLPDTTRPLHTTQVSEKYSCSGCKERWVRVGHDSDCPEGCTTIHREKEKYCPGEHQDITIDLYILFFDEIFTADSMGNAGFNAINGAYIGDFKITHYCACVECCGKTDGITASGAVATPNHTIAVDTSVIPLGTHVMINGIEYVAEDKGGAIDGNRIDIYVSSHAEALQKGTFTSAVYYAGYAGGSVVETGEWEGWTEDNIFWCKNIYSMDWTELYSGIPNVTDTMGNETNLDGVTFIDGDRAGNDAIVNTAMAELGQHGGQPYWSWYGYDSRVEWCATFVSWCANQEGVLGTSIPRFASCRYEGVPWFQSHGQWAAGGEITPVAGDIIFFDWEGDGVPNHVGIVIGTDGSKVYTVEGNSGDTVRTKSYDLNSKLIFGYGLPNY